MLLKEGAFNVYYGGSFDPPHLGHHDIVVALLKDSWSRKVFLVPTSKNPLKKKPRPVEEEIFLQTSQRLEWLRLWVHELKQSLAFHLFSKLFMDLREIQAPGPSYTIDTLKDLIEYERAQGNTAPWVLAIGGDNAEQLQRWKNIEELMGLLHSVWIFARGREAPPLEVIPAYLRALCEYRLMNEKIHDISSTELRALYISALASEDFEKIGGLLPIVKENLTRLVSKKL